MQKKVKGRGRYNSSWELHLRATGRHLRYGITQCYLPPDTSERAPPNPSHAGWYSIYLYHGGMEGWVNLVDFIAPRPGVEPATFRSPVRRCINRYTTKTTNPHCRTTVNSKRLISCINSFTIYFCYTSSRNARLWLVEIASRDGQ